MQNHFIVHLGCRSQLYALLIPSDLVSQLGRSFRRSLHRPLHPILLNWGHSPRPGISLYVADTVNGFIKFAESKKTIGKTINTGSGHSVTIGGLAHLIIERVNSKAVIVCEKKRVRPEKSEVMQLLCDNQRAKDLAGWEPKYTLEDGISLTINWMKENIGSYKTGLYTI